MVRPRAHGIKCNRLRPLNICLLQRGGDLTMADNEDKKVRDEEPQTARIRKENETPEGQPSAPDPGSRAHDNDPLVTDPRTMSKVQEVNAPGSRPVDDVVDTGA